MMLNISLPAHNQRVREAFREAVFCSLGAAAGMLAHTQRLTTERWHIYVSLNRGFSNQIAVHCTAAPLTNKMNVLHLATIEVKGKNNEVTAVGIQRIIDAEILDDIVWSLIMGPYSEATNPNINNLAARMKAEYPESSRVIFMPLPGNSSMRNYFIEGHPLRLCYNDFNGNLEDLRLRIDQSTGISLPKIEWATSNYDAAGNGEIVCEGGARYLVRLA